jgi:hypothetical protein
MDCMYNAGRDLWKKKYYEEKKKSVPIEDKCNKMKQELDQLQRRIVSQLESAIDFNGKQTDDGLVDRVHLSILLI